GQMMREEVFSYYQSLFRGGLTREHAQVWNELACAVADLPAPGLIEDLRQAFEEDVVDPGYATFEELKRDAAIGPDKKPKWFGERFKLIDDAISEMEGWAAFHPDEPRPAFKGEQQPMESADLPF